MARWFSEILAVSADAIFPLIAEFVAGGTGWDLYDDISAHIKVYRCTGGAVTFYVEVDHTTASTVHFKLATGWDNVNHVYSGYKTGIQELDINAGTYDINGDEATLYIMNDLISSNSIIYVGYVIPINPLDLRSICLTGRCTVTTNASAFNGVNSTQMWLYGAGGGNGNVLQIGSNVTLQYSYNADTGVLYVENYRLAVYNQYTRYRAYPKYFFPASGYLPPGFVVGDKIKVQGKTYRFKPNHAGGNCALVQWE